VKKRALPKPNCCSAKKPALRSLSRPSAPLVVRAALTVSSPTKGNPSPMEEFHPWSRSKYWNPSDVVERMPSVSWVRSVAA
jgi:hypothetical protein